MIPLLLILLAGVAWGGETSTLELRDYELVQPVRPVHGTLELKNWRWDDDPAYVVECSSSTTAPRYMVERLFARKDARVPCGDDYETCRDLAEALNEAHRRRVK